MIKEKLLLEVDERREEIVKLCSDLIKIESVNPPGNTIEVIDYICNYLKDANIEYEIRRAEGGPQNTEAELERRERLAIRHDVVAATAANPKIPG